MININQLLVQERNQIGLQSLEAVTVSLPPEGHSRIVCFLIPRIKIGPKTKLWLRTEKCQRTNQQKSTDKSQQEMNVRPNRDGVTSTSLESALLVRSEFANALDKMMAANSGKQ